MTKLGWSILTLIVVVVAGFVAMLSGTVRSPAPAIPPMAASGVAAGQDDGTLPVPVVGIHRDMLTDTWGQPRAGGARHHDAIDIMAPHGTPVVAVADGRIEKLFDSRDGGRTIYLRSGGGGTIYYYAHLDRYSDGLREGAPVRRGQRIATVGSSGNADPGAPHLHFSVLRMTPGEGWSGGRAVDPYPLLAPPADKR